MSLSYILGNLVGRMLLSFLLIFLVCAALNKGQWRAAYYRSTRWYNLLLAFVLALLGLGAAVAKHGGGV